MLATRIQFQTDCKTGVKKMTMHAFAERMLVPGKMQPYLKWESKYNPMVQDKKLILFMIEPEAGRDKLLLWFCVS